VNASHFDEIATVYDESLPAHVVEHYLRKRTAFLTAVVSSGKALDVGCGTGTLAERLALGGYQVTGVDPSDGMLEVLRRRAPMVEAVQGSGTNLPFDADSFDLVFTVATLHHIAEADAVRRTLGEMVRVCRPEGRVVVWDHNPNNPYWSNLMARVPQDTGEERLISAGEIFAGLRGAGARVLSRQALGFVPDFTPRGAIRPAAAFERSCERAPLVRRFAAHNVIVAAKRPLLAGLPGRQLGHKQPVA
jgi:SAM-dependent methyltransferase